MKFEIETLKDYTVIPNEYLRNKNLSLKAKGLLTIFYTLPKEWDYSMKGLVTITNTGITALRNIINELETLGYMERIQTRGKDGKIEYIYRIFLKQRKTIIQNIKKSLYYKRKMAHRE